MTCAHEHDVAAYALGTLDVSDRPALAAHLRACAQCAAQHEALAATVAALHRVPAPPPSAAAPPAALLDRVVATAAAEARRRTTTRRLAAAAAAAVVLLGGGVALSLPHDPPGTSTATIAATRGTVQATVTVTAATRGSDLAMRLTGVPPSQTCRLVAVAADGRRDVAASWQATYTGQATITGHSALAPDRIQRLVVEADDGEQLLELPLPS